MTGFTVDSIIEQSWQNAPDKGAKAALHFLDETRTYAELSSRVSALAGGLKSIGVGHGDRLGILLHNGLEFIEMVFAAARIGAVVIPLNYLLTAAEIADQVADSESTHVLTAASLLEKAPDSADVTLIEVGESENERFSHTFEALVQAGKSSPITAGQAATEDMLLLQYTSGATGTPKAVVHTHSTVLWNAIQQVADLKVGSHDVYLCIPALCWAAGLHDFTLSTIWRGGTVVVFPSRGLKAAAVLETIEQRQVTFGLFVPQVLQGLVEEPTRKDRDLSTLTWIMSGGAPIPVSLLEAAYEAFPNSGVAQAYGMSEFPTIMSVLDDESARSKIGSAGRPSSITSMRIFDDSDEELPAGEVGEIVVRSPATTQEYLNRPEANVESFRSGWFHTGDTGYLDDDGYLFVVGRSKDMIIRGGLNVYPTEIESVIVEFPGVREVAVVGVPDETFGEAGVAVLVTDVDLSIEELKKHCRKTLATFKIPTHWVESKDDLPRTASGKIHKPSVKEWLNDSSESTSVGTE